MNVLVPSRILDDVSVETILLKLLIVPGRVRSNRARGYHYNRCNFRMCRMFVYVPVHQYNIFLDRLRTSGTSWSLL